MKFKSKWSIIQNKGNIIRVFLNRTKEWCLESCYETYNDIYEDISVILKDGTLEIIGTKKDTLVIYGHEKDRYPDQWR